MKKYLILLSDLFVFVVLSGIIHFSVAIVAREWAWFVSNVLSLAIIGYLRVEEIHRLEENSEEMLKLANETKELLDDILNQDGGPHN